MTHAHLLAELLRTADRQALAAFAVQLARTLLEDDDVTRWEVEHAQPERRQYVPFNEIRIPPNPFGKPYR